MKFVLLVAAALPLLAQDPEPLLRIPPVRTVLTLGQQPVEVAASGAVWSAGRPDAYALAVSADLAGLQEHATEILRAQLDRNEACGERIAVHHATLAPAGSQAMLTAELHVERWACAKAFGKNLTKRLAGGDGTVRVALTPLVPGPTEAKLDAQVRDIDADGSLGELLHSGSLGDALRARIAQSVQSALDKLTDLRAALPPALRDAVELRSLAFRDAGGGRLALELRAEAVVSPAQFDEIRRGAQHAR